MRDLEFWSRDGRFGLRVGSARTRAILVACRVAGTDETGGVLIGTYSAEHDCATVTRVCGPAPDSRFGPTWFHRGVHGVQQILDRYWRRGAGFYLGEWHFHPYAEPVPSGIDHGSMRGIARSSPYNCPEPVLLIIGGDPRGAWNAAAFVFLRGSRPVRLDCSRRPD